MAIKEINKFVLESNGKEYDSFEEATIEAMKIKIAKLANEKLFYDYGKIASDFIIRELTV